MHKFFEDPIRLISLYGTYINSILFYIKLAAITVADVTAGITARAVFFCDVTGATIADGVSYSWRQTQNGVFPVDAFPAQIFDQRVSGNFLDTLTITYLSGLEQNYDYRCTVSIGGMMNVIGFATGSLTSPGLYYIAKLCCILRT